MAWRYRGHASVSSKRPVAYAVCDRCGMRYNRTDLAWQFDWEGPRLQNLRLLVCYDCQDKPFEHNRPIVVPPDPVPVRNPRPDLNMLLPPKSHFDRPESIGPVPITLGTIADTFPQTETGAMDVTARLTGFQFPTSWISNSQTLQPQVTTTIVPVLANQWLWLYSPYGGNIMIGQSPYVNGALLNIQMGPGQVYFANPGDGFGSLPTTALQAVALSGQQPIFVAYL